MPLETLLALNYNSFILTVGIISVDSHARDMCGNNGHLINHCIPETIKFDFVEKN